MKNWKFLFLLLIAVGAIIFLYRTCRSPRYKNFPPTATGEWIAFGDSLTAGYGASEGKDYPTLLSQRLQIPIRNLGVPGETTSDGLKRVEEIAEAKPRVVLLCFGGNDALQSLPSEQTFANLGAMIERFQQEGSFVVLIGIRSASLRDRNADHFKKLAKEKNVLYVPDILQDVLGTPSRMSDYVHPNEAGYAFIAERLEIILNPILGKLMPQAAPTK